MSDDDPIPAERPAELDHAHRKERKARKRVRAAWISFVGRIVAQLIGAAATVTLGVLIANRVVRAPAATPAPAAITTVASEPRAGAVAVAVLPLADGRRVRVTAEIVEAEDDRDMWGVQESSAGHALAVDVRLARQVAREVGAALAAGSVAPNVGAVEGDRPRLAAVGRTLPELTHTAAGQR